MKSRALPLAVVCAALFAFSCASTHVVGTWRAPQAAPVHSVVVVGLFQYDGERHIFEDRLAVELANKGLRAIQSYQFIPNQRELNPEQVAELARAHGYDGVLVTDLTGITQRTAYYPPDYGWGPTWGPWWWWSGTYSPGYAEHYDVYRLETRLYRPTTEQGELIWAAESQSVDPASATSLANSLSSKLVKEMRADGVV